MGWDICDPLPRRFFRPTVPVFSGRSPRAAPPAPSAQDRGDHQTSAAVAVALQEGDDQRPVCSLDRQSPAALGWLQPAVGLTLDQRTLLDLDGHGCPGAFWGAAAGGRP
jgi:hypothetical protein